MQSETPNGLRRVGAAAQRNRRTSSRREEAEEEVPVVSLEVRSEDGGQPRSLRETAPSIGPRVRPWLQPRRVVILIQVLAEDLRVVLPGFTSQEVSILVGRPLATTTTIRLAGLVVAVSAVLAPVRTNSATTSDLARRSGENPRPLQTTNCLLRTRGPHSGGSVSYLASPPRNSPLFAATCQRPTLTTAEMGE